MPKIYSWDDLVKGRYASRESIAQAVEDARKIAQKMHDRGLIETALIYGSSARGDFCVGSDIDTLVVSKPGKEKIVTRYLRKVFSEASKRHLEPYVIHITSEDARTGISNISYDFLTRIIASGISVGADPSKVLRISPLKCNQVSNTRNQLRGHIQRAQGLDIAHRSIGDSAFYKNLGNEGGKAVNSAREMVQIFGGGNLGSPSCKIVAEYNRIFSRDHPSSADSLQAIHAALSRYQRELDASVEALNRGDKQEITDARKRFEESRRGLEVIRPHYLNFARENLRMLEDGMKTRPKRVRVVNRK